MHSSTGVVALGSDIGQNISLIKTMTQGVDGNLIIQGSSLKGCIRSVYEVITNSTLGVVSKKVREKIPRTTLLPCTHKNQLCPASRIFGASGQKWG
ncbi:MAG: CRISPR-associated protein, partial [Hydrococcus sp. RM1_1_31]|nr:CRISPR-associated protein [Hydrococcus sp. RM1_1_31]